MLVKGKKKFKIIGFQNEKKTQTMYKFEVILKKILDALLLCIFIRVCNFFKDVKY